MKNKGVPVTFQRVTRPRLKNRTDTSEVDAISHLCVMSEIYLERELERLSRIKIRKNIDLSREEKNFLRQYIRDVKQDLQVVRRIKKEFVSDQFKPTAKPFIAEIKGEVVKEMGIIKTTDK